MMKLSETASSDADQTQRVRRPGPGQREADGERTDHQRRQPAGQQLEGRPAEIGGPPGQLHVDRSGQVDGDVAGLDPVGELGPAEEGDRGQQGLAEPHVRRRLLLVVAGELTAGGRDRGEHDADPDEAEHRLGDHTGGDRHPVGAVPVEARGGELEVGTHKRENLRRPSRRVNDPRASASRRRRVGRTIRGRPPDSAGAATPAKSRSRTPTRLRGGSISRGVGWGRSGVEEGHQLGGAGQHATVDRQGHAGDPGRVVGGQERHGRGDVARLADPAERVERPQAVGATVLAVPDARPDGARSDRVDADARRTQLDREIAGQQTRPALAEE